MDGRREEKREVELEMVKVKVKVKGKEKEKEKGNEESNRRMGFVILGEHLDLSLYQIPETTFSLFFPL